MPLDRPQYYVCQAYPAKGNSVCRRGAFEKEPLEQFVIEQVRLRLMQVLDGGDMEQLRTYVREELDKTAGSPDSDLKAAEDELFRLAAEIDRLLDSITPVNKDLIDERLVKLKHRRRELEARRETIARQAERRVDLEAATNAALAYLTHFKEVPGDGGFSSNRKNSSARLWRASRFSPWRREGR